MSALSECELEDQPPLQHYSIHIIPESIEDYLHIVEENNATLPRPAILSTKVYKRSIKVMVELGEEILDTDMEHDVVSVEMEPMIAMVDPEEMRVRNETLNDFDSLKQQSLGISTIARQRRQRQQLDSPMDDVIMEELEWETLNWIELQVHDDMNATSHGNNGCTEFNHLITGLHDILNDANGRIMYLRLRYATDLI